MAAFVAQLEADAVDQEIRATRPRGERTLGAALVSGLTLLAFALSGYHPDAEDGGLYLAGVNRLLDPRLYPHETAFVLAPTHHSAFAPVLATIVRLTHTGLPWVAVSLHLLSLWVTLFGAWMLAARCWEDRPARAGAVTLLACWLGLPVAGTALTIMDPYLTARSFSNPCMVLGLVAALDITSGQHRAWRLWLLSMALAAIMHPLMAAYGLAASLVLMCLGAQNARVRTWGTAGLCAAALLLAAAVQVAAPAESPDYLRVAVTRTYWFVAQWQSFEWFGLAAPLGILAWSASRQMSPRPIPQRRQDPPPPAARLSATCVVLGCTALVVAAVFARAGAETHLLARMQPLRVFQIVYLIMALVLGAALGQRVLRRSAWRWTAALAVVGAPMLLAARSSYPASPHFEMPRTDLRNPWVQAFLWIRENTPKDALFALDADYINAPGEDAHCFRAIAERSALADYSKDGGEASIAPALTPEWVQGQQAQQGLTTETDRERLQKLLPRGVSWTVLQSSAITGFECPYHNAAVKVCRLR